MAEGRWLRTATTENTPTGEIVWHETLPHGMAAMVGKRCVGAVRKVTSHPGWFGKLEGWVWTVTEDMGSHKFGLKENPAKIFKTRLQAKRAVERAWAVPRHTKGSGDERNTL